MITEAFNALGRTVSEEAKLVVASKLTGSVTLPKLWTVMDMMVEADKGASRV